MVERVKSTLVEVMNQEICGALKHWKYYPESIENMVVLDTLFLVAYKMKLRMTLEVRRDAIHRSEDDDFIRILPQDAEAYGEERGDSWVFSIPPKLEHQSPDPYVLNVADTGGQDMFSWALTVFGVAL